MRIIIGRAIDLTEQQSVEVIETNLDDWSPEGFPYLCELLFAQGALDVTLAPIQMKKGRPGFALQVISPPAYAHLLKEIILSETTAIGLRFRREARRTLVREKVVVPTPWGNILAKKVQTPTGAVIYPEYEECRKIACRYKVPLQQVYNAGAQQQGPLPMNQLIMALATGLYVGKIGKAPGTWGSLAALLPWLLIKDLSLTDLSDTFSCTVYNRFFCLRFGRKNSRQPGCRMYRHR